LAAARACQSLLLINLIETEEFRSGYGIVHQGNFQVGQEGFNQTEVIASAANHHLHTHSRLISFGLLNELGDH